MGISSGFKEHNSISVVKLKPELLEVARSLNSENPLRLKLNKNKVLSTNKRRIMNKSTDCVCPYCHKYFNTQNLETQWDHTYETTYIKCPNCDEAITFAEMFVMREITRNFNAYN
jgi:hypothetical protein